jgi:hypothetical protein
LALRGRLANGLNGSSTGLICECDPTLSLGKTIGLFRGVLAFGKGVVESAITSGLTTIKAQAQKQEYVIVFMILQ